MNSAQNNPKKPDWLSMQYDSYCVFFLKDHPLHESSFENIIQRYSSVYIKNNRFYLMDFICDYFYDNWDMSVISTEYDDPAIKKTLLFSRK